MVQASDTVGLTDEQLVELAEGITVTADVQQPESDPHPHVGYEYEDEKGDMWRLVVPK